jgi:hypothetical protein
VLPVWIAATLGSIAVGLLAADAYLTWLPVVLAGCVLLTFVIQLALRRKEGLVTRMIGSVAGALVIVAIATLVLAVMHPAITVAV